MLGAITAPATTAMIVGSGLGPFPLSYCFDATGSYAIALHAMAISFFASALAVALVRPPGAPAPRAPPALSRRAAAAELSPLAKPP